MEPSKEISRPAFVAAYGGSLNSQTAESQEDADDGCVQTQDTEDGRRGDGDGRSAASVWSANWTRRSCYVVLRKRPRSHPIRGGGSGFPLLLVAGGGLNSTIAGLKRGGPFNAIEEFKGEYRCIFLDMRNANGGQSSGPLEIDRPWDAYGRMGSPISRQGQEAQTFSIGILSCSLFFNSP